MIPAGDAERAECGCEGGHRRRALAPGAGLKPAIAAALLALMLSAGVMPAAAKRLALVIGNDSYQNVTPLQNARADALVNDALDALA